MKRCTHQLETQATLQESMLPHCSTLMLVFTPVAREEGYTKYLEAMVRSELHLLSVCFTILWFSHRAL